jgi:hypothetical protein
MYLIDLLHNQVDQSTLASALIVDNSGDIGLGNALPALLGQLLTGTIDEVITPNHKVP